MGEAEKRERRGLGSHTKSTVNCFMEEGGKKDAMDTTGMKLQ